MGATLRAAYEAHEALIHPPLRRADDVPPAPPLPLFIVAGSYVKRETVDGSTFPRFVPVLCIVEAESATKVSPYDIAPQSAQCVRLTASPVSDLERVPVEARHLMKAQMRALLMYRHAKATEKDAEAMVPFKDYDPIAVDTQVERWAAGYGVRHAGE